MMLMLTRKKRYKFAHAIQQALTYKWNLLAKGEALSNTIPTPICILAKHCSSCPVHQGNHNLCCKAYMNYYLNNSKVNARKMVKHLESIQLRLFSNKLFEIEDKVMWDGNIITSYEIERHKKNIVRILEVKELSLLRYKVISKYDGDFYVKKYQLKRLKQRRKQSETKKVSEWI